MSSRRRSRTDLGAPDSTTAETNRGFPAAGVVASGEVLAMRRALEDLSRRFDLLFLEHTQMREELRVLQASRTRVGGTGAPYIARTPTRETVRPDLDLPKPARRKE